MAVFSGRTLWWTKCGITNLCGGLSAYSPVMCGRSRRIYKVSHVRVPWTRCSVVELSGRRSYSRLGGITHLFPENFNSSICC